MPPAPHRFTAPRGALLVIDVQDRLLAAIADRDRIIANSIRLARAAQVLDLPRLATEQYPERLGPTAEPLQAVLGDRAAKLTFHACDAPGIGEALAANQVAHVTLAGIEAHVCVAQTALELLGRGYRVQVPVDAIGSRFPLDRDVALRRLEQAGAVVTTTEAVLFEWTETAAHPRFKEIAALVKDRPADPPVG